MQYKRFIKAAAMLIGSSWVMTGHAENIGAELGKSSSDESNGYFQMGFLGGWSDRSVEGDFNDFGGFIIEGRYEKYGAFVEVTTDSIGVPGFAIGYELWDNSDWAVDIVAIPVMGELDPSDFDRLENSNLKERNGLTLTGIRATRFFDDFIVQGHVLPLGNGNIASIAVGHFWQIRNWNLSALAALRYNSAEVNDRTWSVAASEASAAFPEYRAGGDVTAMMQLRAEYPITEDWVFEASTFMSRIGDEVADSPLIETQVVKGISFEFSYVF